MSDCCCFSGSHKEITPFSINSPELTLSNINYKKIVSLPICQVVYSLDLSPSVASIDPASSEVLVDTVLCALERVWFALLRDVAISGFVFVFFFVFD
jgi:hypothetical protein